MGERQRGRGEKEGLMGREGRVRERERAREREGEREGKEGGGRGEG